MNEETLFHEALAKSDPQERSAFLDAACAGNPELRAAVEALLVASDPSSFVLDTPALTRSTVRPNDDAPDEGPGTVIGRYKLIEQIGEGGFGIVFMAEQQQPVRRKVAIKTIKPGMDTKQVVARFEAERQALALMDHPNIARVLDGGVTNSQRPYFVMDLVKGIPITVYCDRQQLTPRERLALLVPVCQAVQHAHQKGIIHRDLKPNNVLIASHDGVPVPKLIDFGVAKALGQTLTDRTLVTGFGSIVGTLEYMSPEQAEFNAVDVDTRSDIYSLGVLSYELLTGSTPLTKDRMSHAAMAELLRLIREEDPPRPSTRLSESKETLASISAQRKLEPARLAKEMRGELDWIVMKCLEKDRERRYQTASGLVQDIDRYLRGEAVEAGPPSARYRLQKFARKHRKLLAMITTVALLLAVAVVVSFWQAVRATRAERIAIQQVMNTKAVNDFLTKDLLGQSDIANQPLEAVRDRNVTVRELLDRAATGIDDRFPGQPTTEATIRQTLGNSYSALGEYTEAQKHFERSLELRRASLGPDHPDTLDSMSHLGRIYILLDRLPDAERILKLVQHTLKTHFGDEHVETAYGIVGVARVMNQRGQYVEAEALYRQVLEGLPGRTGQAHRIRLRIESELASLYTKIARYDDAKELLQNVLREQQASLGPVHPDTLVSLGRLADIQRLLGNFDEATALSQQAVDFCQSQLGNNHPLTLDAMNQLALLYRDLGRYTDAEPLFKQVLVGSQKELGVNHSRTLNALNNLAALYRDQGRFEDAAPMFESVVKGLTSLRGPNHPKTLASMNNLAMLYQSGGRYDEAEPLLKRTLKGYQTNLGADHPITLTCMSNLGGHYLDRARIDDAEPLFQQVLEIRQRQLGPDHIDTLTSMNYVALVRNARGEYADAEPLFQTVLEGRERILGADHPDTLRTMNNLAIIFRETARPDEAERMFQNVLTTRRSKLGEDHPDTLATLYNFALLEQTRGRADTAESMFREAVMGARKRLGFGHPQTQRFIGAQVDFYSQQGEPQKAESALRELMSHIRETLGSESSAYAGVLFRLAQNQWQQGKYVDAEKAVRECLSIRTKLEPEAWTTFNTRSLLGAVLLGQKNYADAEPALLSGYRGLKEHLAEIPERSQVEISKTLNYLIQLYDDWNKPDEAAKWRVPQSDTPPGEAMK